MSEKTAHYRRVLWLSEGRHSLQQIVAETLSKCPSVASTKFDYKNLIEVQVSEREVKDGSIGLYFTTFKPGSPTATVQDGGGAINKYSAPKGEEFLKTGIMLVIAANHVAYLADGYTNDGQITAILQQFLKAKGAADPQTQFGLLPKPNGVQLEAILRAGVKSIDLGITNFASTVDELNSKGKNAKWLSPFISLHNQLRDSFKAGRSAAEIEAASEIEVTVHLDYDGRGDKSLVAKVLGELATGVEETASEFRIVTKDNEIITQDKLIMKVNVHVDGDDVATDAKSAFQALKKALADWKRRGMLEE